MFAIYELWWFPWKTDWISSREPSSIPSCCWELRRWGYWVSLLGFLERVTEIACMLACVYVCTHTKYLHHRHYTPSSIHKQTKQLSLLLPMLILFFLFLLSTKKRKTVLHFYFHFCFFFSSRFTELFHFFLNSC